jgi:mycofactocin precursor peptide peptidase
MLGRMRALGPLPWPRLPDPPPVAVLPLGSTEQHGPHLPLDTDTRIAQAVADGLVARLPGLLLAPPLPYGASGEHAGFPGTLSLGTAVLELAVVELVRSADSTAAGVIIVNGHGGNAAPLRKAAARLVAEGRRMLVWAPRAELATAAGVPDAPGDLHAGRTETSILLHLAPELVRLGAARAGPSPALPDLVRHGVRALSPSGVLGDPAGASAAEGADVLTAYVSDAVTRVSRWLRKVGMAGPDQDEPYPPAGERRVLPPPRGHR